MVVEADGERGRFKLGLGLLEAIKLEDPGAEEDHVLSVEIEIG